MRLYTKGTPMEVLSLPSLWQCLVSSRKWSLLCRKLNLCFTSIWHGDRTKRTQTCLSVEWLNDCSWTRLHALTVALAETPDKTCHSFSQRVRKELKSLKTHRISDWSFPFSSLLLAWTIPFQKWWEIITLCPLVKYPALYSSLDLGWMAGHRRLTVFQLYVENVYLYVKIHSFRWQKNLLLASLLVNS